MLFSFPYKKLSIVLPILNSRLTLIVYVTDAQIESALMKF